MSWNGSNYPICLVDWSQLTSKTLMKSNEIDICSKSTTKMGVTTGVALDVSTNDAMGATTDWVLDSLHRTEGSRNPSGYGR